MKGLIGMSLIAMGIFIAVMGGYLLNASDVTTCETEWEYVTDVGGAFVGDKSDMEVEYDPTANVTGWSHTDSYNNGRVSGVDFGRSTSTNVYRAVTGDASLVSYTMTLVADDVSGLVSTPGYTASVSGFDPCSGTMPVQFGLHGAEAATRFIVGDNVFPGAFGMRLSDLSGILPVWSDLYSIGVSVSSVGGLPSVASVSVSEYTGQYVYGNHAYNNVAMEDVYAVESSATAVVYCKEGTVAFGNSRLPLSDVYLVWGNAQFGGTGSSVSSVTVTLSAVLDDQPYAYMDPAAGVTPVYGTYETNTMTFVHHDGSSHPSLTITLGGRNQDTYVTGTVSVAFPGVSGTYPMASWAWVMSGQNNHQSAVTPEGGSEVSASGDGVTGTISASVSGSTMTFSFDGGTASVTIPYPAGVSTIASIIVSAAVSDGLPFTFEAVDDGGTGSSYSGTSSTTQTFPLSYTVYQATPVSVSYSTVYWYNYQQDDRTNSEVVMAFAADSLPASNLVTFRGPDGSSPVRVTCDADGEWTVGGVQVGEWPAVEITVSGDGMTVSPVSRFRTFTDYDVVDMPKAVYATSAVGGGTIRSISVAEPTSAYASLRMAVTSTTAFIPEGGLYLQSGTMDVQNAFPGSVAVSVMIGSAAKAGDSITFSSSSETATLEVDADRGLILVNGRWEPFNGVTFRWYSSSGPSVSIEGQSYQPAIYSKGSTYEAGAVWVETRSGGMEKVIEADTNWSMTLDGVWAPSVFMYTGENVASSSTQIDDFTHGVFKWDKSTFLLVLMAVVISGGVLASYFKVVDLWDWMAIIGAVGVIWLMLG